MHIMYVNVYCIYICIYVISVKCALCVVFVSDSIFIDIYKVYSACILNLSNLCMDFMRPLT